MLICMYSLTNKRMMPLKIGHRTKIGIYFNYFKLWSVSVLCLLTFSISIFMYDLICSLDFSKRKSGRYSERQQKENGKKKNTKKKSDHKEKKSGEKEVKY